MADADVTIKDGAAVDRKIDTRIVNTDEHRQVVVIGDPASTDVASVDGASGGVHVKLVASSLAAPALTVNLVDAGGDALDPLPVSGPLTDTQLRATAVPVSGTVTANAGTGTQAVSLATLPALVAGSAAIGKLAANSGVDIGDVDVLSSALPTGAATSAKQDTQITAEQAIQTAVELIDDTVAVLGTATYTEATTKGLTAGAVRRDADTTLVNTTNEIGPLQMDANGRLKVEAFSGETLPVSGTFWQATQPVSGTVTANAGTGTLAVSIASLPALTTGSAAIGKLAANSGVDIGDVDVTSIIPGTGATNLGKAVDSAGASTDTGVAALGLREDALVVVTPADGDYTRMKMDPLGKQWVNTGLSPELYISKSFNATTTQTGTDVWDPASGKKIAVSSVVIGTYGTTAARVILWFGDNADTTYSAGTDQVLLAASFAPSATAKPGLVFTPAQPVICNTADRELHITTDAGISIDVVCHGFEF